MSISYLSLESSFGETAGLKGRDFIFDLLLLLSLRRAAYEVLNPVRQAFFDRWVSPRRNATIADLQRGKNAGELRSYTEPDLLNDAIFGAIYYRFLLGLGPFTRRFGEELVEQVIRWHRSGNARS